METITITTKQETKIFDFQEFSKRFPLKVVKIGVACSKCEKYFNIHITDEKSIWDIEPHKMVCGDCLKIESENRRKQLLQELGY
jgi:uncharacterized CHY-type Zn-finger protein